MSALVIPASILAAMVEQAREAAPIEACGILGGNDGCVGAFYPMSNADRSTDHFSMAPEEQFAVVRLMRTAGQRMLAIYHSHPDSPARPSQEDIRLALTPDVVYLILSLLDPERPVIKGFHIDGATVTDVPVVVDDQKRGEL